jgi:endonuclease YncB( thermonuclease family)
MAVNGSLAIAVLAMLLLPLAATGASLSGRVLAVDSGSSLTITTSAGVHKRVRLTAIQTPQPNTLMGIAARRHLRMLVAGKVVELNYTTVSRDGRLVGQLFHGGADVAVRLLESGLAWLSGEVSLSEKDGLEYRNAMSRAQRGKLGIWKNRR